MKEKNEVENQIPSIQFEASIKLSMSDWRISYRISKGWLVALGVRIAIMFFSKHS